MRRPNMLGKQRFFLACLLFACLLPFGCVHSARGDWREYKIFCGMSRDSGTVSNAELQQFCENM